MAKVKIVAEVGINHDGNLLVAKETIWRAKEAGADIWKTQAYSATALFGLDGQTPNPTILQQVAWMNDIGQEELAQMKQWCREAGIEFMCSAFDNDRLSWLEAIGVVRHKIASRMFKFDPVYCQTVFNLEKETFVSLGMVPTQGPWPTMVPMREDIHLLYCVAEYPTPLSHIHLPTFTNALGGIHGFSDHSEGIAAALVAVARGAQIIEKHVTLDKNLPGPDQKASITFQELKELVRITREMEQIPGVAS